MTVSSLADDEAVVLEDGSERLEESFQILTIGQLLAAEKPKTGRQILAEYRAKGRAARTRV